jgi:hypothetical protein
MVIEICEFAGNFAAPVRILYANCGQRQRQRALGKAGQMAGSS